MVPTSHPSSARLVRRKPRGSAAGFTLAEVLAVVAIIGVLAATATPGFVSMMRERRTARETGMFADAFRVARAKALGRGAAVRVNIVPGTTPYLALFEHMSGTLDTDTNLVGADSLPVPGCRADGVWRAVDSYSGRSGATMVRVFGPGTAVAAPLSGGDSQAMSVCYTPRGRTYYDGTGGDAFVPLEGVVTMTTERGSPEGSSAANSFRKVLVMPNGLTRMAL